MQSSVELARVRVGLSKRELASLAGVSPSTVGRIEAGTMDPTVTMVQRLIAAAGAAATVSVTYLSDPAAIAAARAVLDPHSDLIDNPGVPEWIARFSRLGWLDGQGNAKSPRALACRAARFAALAQRPNIRTFTRNLAWDECARRLNESGVTWAATGATAANELGVTGDTLWPVFYVSDLRVAARELGLEEFRAPGLAISLIPFDGMSERGSRCDGAGNSWAAPLQVLMDCYAGIDRMPDLAEALANRWDAEAGQ
jgi:transcriptional regulator with XRE-family HTH domain